VGVTLLGYWLGQFEFVQTYLEPILIGIVVISVIPVAVELLRARRNGRAAKTENIVVELDHEGRPALDERQR
jgi:membrane-associated protein